MDIKKILYVVDVPNTPLHELKCDYILNLSSDNAIDPRLLNEAELYQLTLHETRVDYIKFLQNFSHESGLIKRPFFKSSIWWFTEIQVKDSLWTTFFGDLVASIFIKNIEKKYNIGTIEIISENNFLNSVFGNSPKKPKNYIIKLFLSRFKLFAIYLRSLSAKEKAPQTTDTLFLSFFPQTFFKTNTNQYKERVWGDWIKELPEATLGVFLNETNDKNLRAVESRFKIIQKHIHFHKALWSFLNCSHLFWYFLNKNRILGLAHFKNVDLKDVFDKFLLKSFIFNDLYYSQIIQGVEGIAKKMNVKRVISTGEFGLESKAISLACSRLKIQSHWYQHSLFSTSKLWLQNSPEDIPVSYYKETSYVEIQMEKMPLPDEIWVWSPFWFKYLMQESHIPENRIRAVECYKKLSRLDYKKYSPVKSAHKFLFSPTLSETEIFYFASLIKELLQKKILAKNDIVLKLHPAATKNFDIPQILKNCHIDDIEIDSAPYNAMELSKKVKCIISGGTIVGLESAYLGFPIIQYIPMYALNWGAFEKEDVPHFSDLNELIPLIKNYDKLEKINALEYFFPTKDDDISFVNTVRNLKK